MVDLILKEEFTLAQAETEFGIAARTIRFWKNKYLTFGLSGLERQKRSDKGRHRKVTEELVDLTKALALQKPPLTVSAIHRKITQLSRAQSIKPPSYRTVYEIVREVSPALLTLAHMGSQAYRQKYELIFRRECQQSNEIWQVDHTQLDLYLLDSKGKERKPWLTIVKLLMILVGLFVGTSYPLMHPALYILLLVYVRLFGEKKIHSGQCVGFQKQFIQTMEATLCLYILSRFVFTLKSG